MQDEPVSARTRALAERSARCLVCQRARRKQAGLAFWLVRTFEKLCPFCRAYEKVHGRKSHEPDPRTQGQGPRSALLLAVGLLPWFAWGAEPPASPPDAPRLNARTWNSGFPQAHDTYNAMGAASDGKI